MRVLILGGSSEASALVQVLAGHPHIAAILSLAGRTRVTPAQPVATRIGGFGGIDGLVAYLKAERIEILVDATHPFAAQMSRHAREAAAATGCPLIHVSRPPWRPEAGDSWHEVADMAAAAEALGREARRVFLTVGRLQLAAFARAPQHHYVVRSIDPIGPDHGLPDASYIEARGPFDADSEIHLLREHRIDVLVTKNSGGTASAAKLVAARALGLPVVLVARPETETGVEVATAVAMIEAHHASTLRGV